MLPRNIKKLRTALKKVYLHKTDQLPIIGIVSQILDDEIFEVYQEGYDVGVNDGHEAGYQEGLEACRE